MAKQIITGSGNSTTAPGNQRVEGVTISIPDGARAVLVYRDVDTGELSQQPVPADAAVLRIRHDLLKHLNEQPYSDEWLGTLRDYCDQRITARQKARAAGSVVVPSSKFEWDMVSVKAVQS